MRLPWVMRSMGLTAWAIGARFCSHHKSLTAQKKRMKIRYLTTGAVLVAVLAGGTLTGFSKPGAKVPGAAQPQSPSFGDTAETDMLHRAYRILATGDHDYKGHRVKAMGAVKAAAALLGLDLSGDDRDKEKQVLSDDELREAQGLLQQVLSSDSVQGQKAVSVHLNTAIKQISIALSIK
jgi:hypothetical protein